VGVGIHARLPEVSRGSRHGAHECVRHKHIRTVAIYTEHMGHGRCTDCDGGLLGSDGKCAMCHGTGKNVHLNSDQADCEKCGGSGVCPACRGTGRYGGASDFTDIFSS